MSDYPVIDGCLIREAIDRSLRAILIDGIGVERYSQDVNFHHFVDQIVRSTVHATVEVIEGRSRRVTPEELQERIELPLIGRDEIVKMLGIEHE